LQDWLHGGRIMSPTMIAWPYLWSRCSPARSNSPQASMPMNRRPWSQQIEATDRQIDALVYELYALTEEEIAIVEGVS